MKKQRKTVLVFAVSAVLLLILALVDFFRGAGMDRDIISHIRLPRILTAVIAGASLSLAGAQMQSILRNPLADPYIMGMSSGASLGAALVVMTCGAGGITLAASAFVGCALCGAVVLLVARKFQDAKTLLVFGVLLGFIVSAIVSVLQSYSAAENFKIFYGWMSGSFSTAGWNAISLMGFCLIAGLFLSLSVCKGLDAVLFGDEYALMCGHNPLRIRMISVLSSCVLTSAVTAFCGPVGFVGIVTPHIARAVSGTSAHRIVLPLAVLCGAAVALFADLLSCVGPYPVPVSATMAIVGIPLIIYILLKKS